RAQLPGKLARHGGGGAQAVLIDVVQADPRVGQLRKAQDVGQQRLREHGAARANQTDLRHVRPFPEERGDGQRVRQLLRTRVYQKPGVESAQADFAAAGHLAANSFASDSPQSTRFAARTGLVYWGAMPRPERRRTGSGKGANDDGDARYGRPAGHDRWLQL